MNDKIIQEKIEEINNLPTWSGLWLRKSAMEFLGTDEISWQGQLPKDKELIIDVKCDDDEKFNVFKEFIRKYAPILFMTVIIRRMVTVRKEYILSRELS